MDAFLYERNIPLNLIGGVCVDINFSEEILVGVTIISLTQTSLFFNYFPSIKIRLLNRSEFILNFYSFPPFINTFTPLLYC
jgi:hypothetical protein